MTYLVVSDTHGNTKHLAHLCESAKGADGIFFLGDGIKDIVGFCKEFPALQFYAVRGNCDREQSYQTDGLVTIMGYRILYTHGNLLNVKLSLAETVEVAKQQDADIVLFGHTHHPFDHIIDDIHLFNPGALGRAFEEYSYGVMHLEEGKKPRFEHVILRI